MNGMLLNALKSPSEIFQDEGILFYPRLFEGEQLNRLREACERIYQQNLTEARAVDAVAADNLHEMRHLNHPRFESPNYEDQRLIMETVADPRCVGLVEQIFGGPSLFYTTSLFFNPVTGKQDGDWHRDQQFILQSEEAVREYYSASNEATRRSHSGIQLQIALIDNEDIEYVPFSAHRYDSPQEHYIRCADERAHNRDAGMPGAMRVHQRAGDAVAFNANGLHRGRYHSDIPRRTLMLTYTPHHFRVNSYFSNQPWMLEPGYIDNLSRRARAYFEEFIEAYRDSWTQKQ